MNYYRRYMGDYQKKTMRLTPTDHGVYDLMLDYCYSEEEPLPLEMDDIYAICKAVKPDDRKSVSKVLRLYFEEREDGFHNKRVDEEIAVSKQARENGNRGGRPKTEKITGPVTEDITETITENETETETKQGGGLGHPPTTNHQPPTTSLQPPSANHHPTPASAPRKQRATAEPAKTGETWESYATAYQQRYGVAPLRDATTNSQLSKFIDRVGIADAPAIAAHYVGSSRSIFVVRKHPIGMLLSEAEGLRTEWATRRQGTETEARQADRTQAVGNVWTKLIGECSPS